jgi:molecular chaperone DnaJ
MGSGRNVQAHHQGMFFFQQDLGPCGGCRGKGKIFEHSCNKCSGAGELLKQETFDIEIRPGILNRSMMLHDKNLIIEFILKSEKFVADQNFNMFTDIEIDPIEAILGKALIFEHPNGTKLKFNTKKNLEHASQITVKNKGFPASETQYGDLIVRFLYKNPIDVSEEEENILKSYIEMREKRNLL